MIALESMCQAFSRFGEIVHILSLVLTSEVFGPGNGMWVQMREIKTVKPPTTTGIVFFQETPWSFPEDFGLNCFMDLAPSQVPFRCVQKVIGQGIKKRRLAGE